MLSPARVLGFGKRVLSDVADKNVTFMAASIAYNAFVSLAPLLILFLLFVSTIGGGLEARLVEMAQGGLPAPIADVIERVFADDATGGGASAVGLLVLVWGALKIFRGLDTAFSAIYETEAENSFVDQLLDGAVVLVGLVVAIVATVAVTAVFARFEGVVPFVGFLTPLALVAGLIVAFFPMYYRFPDAELGLRDVLPGTVFGAVGWAVLQSLFQVYLTFTGGGVGSFFGGVIVIVTWLYFSGLVLLLGAVLNAVAGGHSSGAASGVGTPPDGADTDAEMDRDELAGYLRDLREELTGRYEGMRPGGETPGRHGRPAGDVEVVERSDRDGDGRTRTVTLRWRTAGDDSN